MERKIKDGNYITIQSFMVTDFGLKGNELLIYACIFGFSQSENQSFTGSLSYLAEWASITKQSVINCLKSLEAQGLIEKKENFINGVKFCEYRAVNFNGIQKNLPPLFKNFDRGIQKILPNNIEENKEDISKKVSKRKKDITQVREIPSYDDVLDGCGVTGEYRNAVFRFIQHLQLNGVKVINDRVIGLVVKLDLAYGADEQGKVDEIDEAIRCGYKRLPCEE